MLRPGQVVALDFQLPCLFLQLGIGLFQFRLLRLQSRGRLLQMAALLLQFFIIGAQLLALRLQFLGLLLRFFQQFAQPRAIFA